MSERKDWYILIGVNHYINGSKRRLSASGGEFVWGHLYGCVRDVDEVYDYLTRERKVKPNRITKLVSEHHDQSVPKWEDAGPVGPSNQWPTYRNILTTISQTTSKAKKGDLVYIHYAGHGGSLTTIYPEIKGVGQLDESLVPCDIQLEGGRHIRDLELAIYLNRMVEKGLIVTIILDSCHSSSATRGELDNDKIRYRTSGHVDATPEEPVFTTAEIRAAGIPIPTLEAKRASRNATGVDEAVGSMGLVGRGYELIAACRFDELAGEEKFKPGVVHGLLSYYYLKALREGGPNLTHYALFQRLLQLIVDPKYPWRNQVPVFVGNGGRLIFENKDVAKMEATVNIKRWETDSSKNKTYVILAQGRLQGICRNAEYLLFPWTTTDFRTQQAGAPKVKVIEVDELFSKAEFIENPLPHNASDEKGYVAYPIKSPLEKVRLRIIGDPNHGKLAELQKEVGSKEYRAMDLPVTFVPASAANADYSVGVDNDKYVLLDDASHARIPNFPSTSDVNHFLEALKHLAKYRMVKNIYNENDREMAGKYQFEFSYKPSGSNIETKANETCLKVHDGDKVSVIFTNKHTAPLNVCILNLQPLWGIAQIHPPTNFGEVFDTVPAGASIPKHFQFSLPETKEPTELTDFLKAFVFFEKDALTDFRTLYLPELKEDNLDGKANNRGSNELARLFAMLGIPSRNAIPLDTPPPPWQTSTLSVVVKPRDH